MSYTQLKKNIILDEAKIKKAISWIKNQQNNNGAYTTDNDLVLPEQSTSEALSTFHALGLIFDESQDKALTFLNSSSDESTEFIARRIIANAAQGNDNSSLVLQLKTYQNQNGGFGFIQGFDSFVLDTVWALKALGVAGQASTSEANRAIAWILSKQQAEGGWENALGYNDIYSSALAVDALWQYRTVYNINDQLHKAVQWLLDQRNTEGYWEYTDYTALALLAMLPSLKDIVQVMPAIDHLVSIQGTNDSWEDDVYVTSLVLRALNGASEIGGSDVPLLQGRVVDADTRQVLAGVIVTFQDQTTTTDQSGSFSIPIKIIGESQIVVSQSGYSVSQRSIIVSELQTIQLGDIQLKRVANTTMISGFITDQSTGKAIDGATISLSDGREITSNKGYYQITVDPGIITITVTAYGYHNVIGSVTINTGEVIYFSPTLIAQKNPVPTTISISGRILDEQTMQPLKGVVIEQVNGSKRITSNDGVFQFSDLTEDIYTYIISLEGYLNKVMQVSLSENSNFVLGDILLQLAPTETGSSIRGIVTDVTTGQPISGASVVIVGDNNKTVLTAADGSYKVTGLNAGNITITISVNGYKPASTKVTIDNITEYILSVSLYADSQTGTDKTAVKGIVVDSISGLPLSDVVVAATVNNITSVKNTNATGEFVFENIEDDVVLLAFTKKDYRDTSFEISMFEKQINDLGQIRLASDDNQNYKKLADLVVDFVAPVNLNTDQQTLEVSGSVAVTVSNLGRADVPAGFNIIAFKDNNHSGRFDAGIDTVLGQITVQKSLQINQTETYTIPVSGKLDFRDAPVYVIIDSENKIEELSKQNNVGSTAMAARIKPEIGEVELVLKWRGDYLNVTSGVLVIPTRDTNGDGIIDSKDMPSIIFLSHNGFGSSGTLHILDGDTGEKQLTIYNPEGILLSGWPGIAAADIDHDGLVEVLVTTRSGQLAAICTMTGKVKWLSTIPSSPYPSLPYGGGPSIVDLNSDGNVEILFGRHVLNGSDGSLLWAGKGSFHGGKTGMQSFAADINLDGFPEVIVGASAYDYQGNLLWQNNTVGDGYTAVGKFNSNDNHPQIVISATGKVFMLNYKGEILWGPVGLPGGGNGGAPVIADMDGDGVPEIGIAGAYYYTVFKADGSILWNKRINDSSSSQTGSSVFDFDGDGRAEVVYADETQLHIYDGETGDELFTLEHTSSTAGEYPVIADINNDGHAELLVVGDHGKHRGLRVFQGKNNSWVRTRNIWNQYDYHINNITDDLVIPTNQGNSWELHNTFRLNRPLDLDPTVVADLTASYIRVEDKFGQGDSILTARIGNGGGYAVPSGVSVAFYSGDPKAGGVLLGVVKTSQALNSDEYQDVSLSLADLSNITILYAVADDDGTGAHAIDDANRANNTATLDLTSLRYGTLNVSTDQQYYLPQTNVQLQALANNRGRYSGKFTLQLSILDVNSQIVTVMPLANLGVIAANAKATHLDSWNTELNIAGNYILHGKLMDEQGETVAEDSSSFTILSVASGEPAGSLRISADKPEYLQNDQVELTALYRNLSVNTSIKDAFVELTVVAPSSLHIFSHKQSIGEIPANSSFNQFTVNQVLLNAELGDYAVIAKLFNGKGKILASTDTSYKVVQDPKQILKSIIGELTLQKTELNAGETQSRNDTVSNKGTGDILGLKITRIIISDNDQSESNLLEATINLSAGQKQEWLNTPIDTRALLKGSYTALLIAEFDGHSVLLDNKVFNLRKGAGGLGIAETTLITTGAALYEGDVYIWGFRGSSQQGNGTMVVASDKAPAKVNSLSNIIALTGGAYHLLALDDKGNVYGWGQSGYGETGCAPTQDIYVSTPAKVLGNIKQIAAGEYFSIALDNSGQVWTWGHNLYGQLGNGNSKNSQIPVAVDLNGEKARLIGAAYEGAFAVTEQGHVWAWGDNEASGLGFQGSNYGVQKIIRTPTRVSNLDIYANQITYIAGGNGWGEALLDNGTVIGWGMWASIGLGIRETNIISPEPMVILRNVKQLFARYVGSFALTHEGLIYTWGQTGGCAFPMIYGDAPSLRNRHYGEIEAIGGGKEHLFYRTTDGNLYGVGYNDIHKLDQSKFGAPNIDWPGKQIVLNP